MQENVTNFSLYKCEEKCLVSSYYTPERISLIMVITRVNK